MAWEVPQFTKYLEHDRGELLYRLAEVTYELANIEQELELSLATETQVRYETWVQENTDLPLTARDAYSKHKALSATVASHEAKGLRNALLHERDLIHILLREDNVSKD